MHLEKALNKAGPIYKRALAQAVDHGVPVDEAALVMTMFAIGALIGAVGDDAAERHLKEISEGLASLGHGQGGG